MSTEKLLTLIENVRTARAAVRALGAYHQSKAEKFTKARSALALAESALREESLRLGICVTVLEPEREHREPMVCARTLPGYGAEE